MPLRPTRALKQVLNTRRKGNKSFVLPFLVLSVGVCAFAIFLLKSGRILVHGDAFEKAPWAVVLAGQSRDCERTDAAAALALEGKVDTVVVSGCRAYKERYESEFILSDMLRQGLESKRLFELRQDAYSTLEEAEIIVQQMRRLSADTVVIVTSDYHTARSRMIFQALSGGDPVFLFYPVRSPGFRPEAWWSGRESRKTWLVEWAKFIYNRIELLGRSPMEGEAGAVALVPDVWSGLQEPVMQSPIEDSVPAPKNISTKLESDTSRNAVDALSGSDSTVEPKTKGAPEAGSGFLDTLRTEDFLESLDSAFSQETSAAGPEAASIKSGSKASKPPALVTRNDAAVGKTSKDSQTKTLTVTNKGKSGLPATSKTQAGKKP